jgi:hypothetical protein
MSLAGLTNVKGSSATYLSSAFSRNWIECKKKKKEKEKKKKKKG